MYSVACVNGTAGLPQQLSISSRSNELVRADCRYTYISAAYQYDCMPAMSLHLSNAAARQQHNCGPARPSQYPASLRMTPPPQKTSLGFERLLLEKIDGIPYLCLKHHGETWMLIPKSRLSREREMAHTVPYSSYPVSAFVRIGNL